MLQIKKYLAIFITILIMGCYQACKPVEPIKDVSYFTIRGTITGQFGVRDSIRILFGGLIPESKLFGTKDTLIYVGADGKFVFHSVDIQEPTRVSIISYKKRDGELRRRHKDVLKNFLVNPGDAIEMVINESGEDLDYDFSGAGAAKFKVQWQNLKNSFKVNRRTIQMRYSHNYANLLTRVHIADSISNMQIRVLETVKDSISEDTYKLLKADILGENGVYLKLFDSKMQTDKCTEEQLQTYQKLFDQSLKTDIPSDILARSPYYIMFLSNMAIAQLQLENPLSSAFKYDHIFSEGFAELCHIWRSQYSGKLREQLLLYNLQSIKVQDTYGMEECLHMSYQLFETPELKAIMETMYGRQIRGSKVFDFSLPNTEGQMVKLSDFKGKVVYLDIWFTGCKACMVLADKVDHKVYPEFKNNPNVVFVSISGDTSKNRWLESVESERYGLKDYVNLYTDGLGFKHDFMLYYGIEGGPTTMLIDRQGNLYSVAPPKHGKSEALITLIKEALEY